MKIRTNLVKTLHTGLPASMKLRVTSLQPNTTLSLAHGYNLKENSADEKWELGEKMKLAHEKISSHKIQIRKNWQNNKIDISCKIYIIFQL